MVTTASTSAPLPGISQAVTDWVASVRELTQPQAVHWVEGSDAEYHAFIAQLEQSGELQKFNEAHYPNCFLARSHPSDVARVEHLTFVCTTNKDDAGPNNNWMAPADAHAKMSDLFKGCMKGRTLYVVPYSMGPIDSP
jgi:phosphoenolpyruvate carboxykinase (GTP)